MTEGRTAGVVGSRVDQPVDAGIAGGGLARVEVAAQHVDAKARAAFPDITAQCHTVGLAPRHGVADVQTLRVTSSM